MVTHWQHSMAYVLLFLTQALLASAQDRYGEAVDIAILPDGLNPREYLGAWPAKHFAKRDGGSCVEGSHTCLELGDLGASSCCPNDMYCYFYSNWTVGCCGMGTNCDTLCPSAYVRFNQTVTL